MSTTPMMFCHRCEQVYETSKLICTACGNVMVGAGVDASGEVMLIPAPRRPPTHLPMPGTRLDHRTPVR